MLKIYLCEDSKPQLDALESTIQKYLFINHSNGKIVCKTQNPMELLSYLHAAPSYLGLYYLDVEFDCQFDGFSLAQKIREIDPRCYIVFITVHHSFSMEPYRHHIEALDFIWKEDMHMKSRITQSLQKALDNYGHCMGPVLKKELVLKTHNDLQYLETDRILYLESAGKEHKVNIYTENSFTQSWGSLNELISQLPSELFFRCHHSYIVNRLYIEKAMKKEHQLLLRTGSQIPYSFRRQSTLFEWLKKYHIPVE